MDSEKLTELKKRANNNSSHIKAERIITIFIDTMGRRRFYKTFPKSIKYLKSLLDNNEKLFISEQLKELSLAPFTDYAMPPFLYGGSVTVDFSPRNFTGFKKYDLFDEMNDEPIETLVDKLKSYGYVTGYSADLC